MPRAKVDNTVAGSSATVTVPMNQPGVSSLTLLDLGTITQDGCVARDRDVDILDNCFHLEQGNHKHHTSLQCCTLVSH